MPAAVLITATVVAYWPVTHAGFVFDDDPLVLTNPCITGDDGLYRIWLTNENYDYLPLTYTAFWAEHRLWGADPLGYHLVSVGLQLANAFLLWRLLWRLGIPGAWWGALLFAVHPVAASSVAWISEQKNLWGLLFALASLSLYLRFEAGGRWRWYVLSFVTFVAALLGKTSVVMVPCLMVAYEYRRTGRLRTTDVLKVAPFFLASLALGLVTVWFQVHRAITGATIPIGTYWERFEAAGYVVWFYLGKAVAPVGLSLIYRQWPYAEMTWWPTAALVGLLALFWTYRRHPWARAGGMALACFTTVLVPVLGFVPMSFMRFSLVADHLQYAALPALTALAGGAVAAAIRRWRLAGPAAATIVVALVVLTLREAATYRDDETLWRKTIRRNPEAWLAYGNLAKALTDRGDTDGTVECYAAVVGHQPGDSNLRGLYGDALLKRGDLAGAAAQYRAAVRLQANDLRARNNLAHVLLLQGKTEEALVLARAAVALQPDVAVPHYNLAWALNELGRPADAAAEANSAVTLDPGLTEAHFQLGVARLSLGDGAGADAEFEQTLRLNPGHALAHNNLASSLNRRGQPAAAAEHALAALAVEPGLARARFNLGNAYYLQSRFPLAEREYRHALRLDPKFAEAEANLRAVLNRR